MMENTELIKVLRHCSKRVGCRECPIYRKTNEACFQIMADAADALEEADEKIADYTAAIDALDDSNDAYIKGNERLEKRIAELEKQLPKWVSVEDKLPEESGEYTVYIQMGTGVEVPDFFGSNDLSYVTSIYFRKEQNIWLDEYDESYNADLSLVDTVNAYHVTHWMPLPQKPKVEHDD